MAKTIKGDKVKIDFTGRLEDLAGPIAQFGRTGLINEVSKRLIDEFSECLHKKLDADSPEQASAIEAADVRGISLFLASTFGSFTAWWKRTFSRSDR